MHFGKEKKSILNRKNISVYVYYSKTCEKKRVYNGIPL